jgi:hypothetical protein
LGWFSLLVTTKKATMDFITNETQINNSADIITSLKRGNSKVYDYLVTVDAKIVQLKLGFRIISQSIPS